MVVLLSVLVGCGTTTTHTVTEQLLVSAAVDEAISQISFEDLRGEAVYLDNQFVQPVKELGQANTNYILSSLRQHMIASGCLLQDNRDAAKIIVEPRVGALGTEGQVVTFGIPQSNELSTAASIFAQSPVVPRIPEISFGKSDLKSGAAKLAIFAYDRETREPFWQSGTRIAHSNSKSTWVMGAGPFERGTIHERWRFNGIKLPLPLGKDREEREFIAPSVPYAQELRFHDLEPIQPQPAEPEAGEPEQLAEQPDAIELTGHTEAAPQSSPPASGESQAKPEDGRLPETSGSTP